MERGYLFHRFRDGIEKGEVNVWRRLRSENKGCVNRGGEKGGKRYLNFSRIEFDEGFLRCTELGNFTSLANFTNFEVSRSSNSAMKTGTTEIFSTLFRTNAHSYLE